MTVLLLLLPLSSCFALPLLDIEATIGGDATTPMVNTTTFSANSTTRPQTTSRGETTEKTSSKTSTETTPELASTTQNISTTNLPATSEKTTPQTTTAEKVTTQGTSTTTTTATGTTTPDDSTEAGTLHPMRGCTDQLCEFDGLFSGPEKCSPDFCHCSWAVPHPKVCQPGLVFNPDIGVCDWPWDTPECDTK